MLVLAAGLRGPARLGLWTLKDRSNAFDRVFEATVDPKPCSSLAAGLAPVKSVCV